MKEEIENEGRYDENAEMNLRGARRELISRLDAADLSPRELRYLTKRAKKIMKRREERKRK